MSSVKVPAEAEHKERKPPARAEWKHLYSASWKPIWYSGKLSDCTGKQNPPLENVNRNECKNCTYESIDAVEDTIIFQVDGNNSDVSDNTTDSIVDNSIVSDSDYDTEDELPNSKMYQI